MNRSLGVPGGGTVILHSSDQKGLSYVFRDPAERFVGSAVAVYEAAREAWKARGGWLAGAFSAEAGHFFDAAPGFDNDPWPHCALFRYDHAEVIPAGSWPVPADAGFTVTKRPSPDRARALIEDRVAAAREYVHAGDIFQANISQRFSGKVQGVHAPMGVFDALARANPAPMAAFCQIDADRAVASHSPERYFALDAAGVARTWPIKGTRPRARQAAEDERLARQLQTSAKDRAENVMIVDLMRNDFARVCVPGSVTVPVLCGLESYANVHHLVSRVRGKLRDDCDVFDLLAATFPPGSVTGAPKIRALEVIAELEAEPRGAYCGAMGYIAPDGSADFNVMIRSVSFQRERGDLWRFWFRSGGGIVADSDPAAEYEETLTKARTLLEVLQ